METYAKLVVFVPVTLSVAFLVSISILSAIDRRMGR